MKKKINSKYFYVENNEYQIIKHKKFKNLKIANELGLHERLIGYIEELAKCFDNTLKINLICIDTTHGGFLPISLADKFENIYLLETKEIHNDNIIKNISNFQIKNIIFADWKYVYDNKIKQTYNNIYFSNKEYNYEWDILLNNGIVITNSKFDNIKFDFKKSYNLKNTTYHTYLNNYEKYEEIFKYYVELPNINNYDNLVNLCVMVKNGGEQFENFIKLNYNIFDVWTILDTGSTDNTVKYINDLLVGKKKGQLYIEPFINFCESRNRLLDLASTQCKFNIMLDDTYIMKGNIRNFLNEVRGDQYSTSFSIYIQNNDIMYNSNRIIKSSSELRYKYRIHEVITDKNNIMIQVPELEAYILDLKFDYMEKRTMDRIKLDLILLYEELEENPNEPRTYYYLGQTYNLLDDFEKAYEYFIKRGNISNSGYIQERIDAIFEAAKLANFKLNMSWNECEKLYMTAYEIDKTRPDSLYHIGIHYYTENNIKQAYYYFKKSFEIGCPIHTQYSVKPTISYYFIPKFLSKICYQLEDYELGEQVAKFFLIKNDNKLDDYREMSSWYKMFKKINTYKKSNQLVLKDKIVKFSKPIIIFVADGGFESWTGSNILKKGIGGSETYIIEMAKNIQKSNIYDTIVFANTPDKKQEYYENTLYTHLDYLYEFINTTYIHTCIVSRFSEYLGVCFKSHIENVYMVIHDLEASGNVIPVDKKLKKIFCMSEWHKKYFISAYPSLEKITDVIYNGHNVICDDDNQNINTKIKNKFIYSSYPNRGLLELLKMWPNIHNKYNNSSLYIYSDINNKWSNDTEPEKMSQIKNLITELKNKNMNINYFGWVNKNELIKSWKTSEYWLYPCTFTETFCITALEAAITKTLVITTNLGGLVNTVGDRGIIIEGDVKTDKWKNEAFDRLFYYMDEKNNDEKEYYINKNFEWAKNLTWDIQAKKLLFEIEKNKLEYKNVYDWEISTEIFLKVLDYFKTNNKKYLCNNTIEILEINSWVGITMFNLLTNINNSNGTVIDNFDKYYNYQISESFDKNLNIFKLSNKINKINSNNVFSTLLEFVKNNNQFDIIYIGENLLKISNFDNYKLLCLSWEILNVGGYIGVSDYKENLGDELIELFLTNNSSRYKLINKDYRVFIEKIM